MLLTTATIGGTSAEVEFSGLAPGYAGLAQANLVIPDLPPGEYPVILTIGGVESNSALIFVGSPK
jgi:uncharacterized protein (TIGR03437 family)